MKLKVPTVGNAAAGNAYNVADMASLLQVVRNAGVVNPPRPAYSEILTSKLR